MQPVKTLKGAKRQTTVALQDTFSRYWVAVFPSGLGVPPSSAASSRRCFSSSLRAALYFAFGPLFLSVLPLSAAEPLIHAHAHNDYEHKRPLLDALDHGFCSVEADIFLVTNQLLVAHNISQIKPERTIQSLYLDPLRLRVKQNGGRVYPNGPEFSLLIDLKTEWRATYPVLRLVLIQYSDMLTTSQGDSTQTNAIRVIITGDRSKEMFAGETIRYASFDGDLPDLDSSDSPAVVPWVSSSWTRTFRWRGTGPMPPAEVLKLRNMVDRAHKAGRLLRFWGAPDQEDFWREMSIHGVDLINTDNLAGLQKFFAGKLMFFQTVPPAPRP